MKNIEFYCPKANWHGLKTDPAQIFLVIPNTEKDCCAGCIMTYAPIGQHSEAHKDYIDEECREITKRDYLAISNGIYTPEEYLKNENIKINAGELHLLEVRLSSNIGFLEFILENYGDMSLRRDSNEIENGEPQNLSNIIEDLKDIDNDIQEKELEL